MFTGSADPQLANARCTKKGPIFGAKILEAHTHTLIKHQIADETVATVFTSFQLQ